jgi:hypothetical protein
MSSFEYALWLRQAVVDEVKAAVGPEAEDHRVKELASADESDVEPYPSVARIAGPGSHAADVR